MPTSAKVIEDTLSSSGVPLTTMVVRYPRVVHAEFMTHRMFSRNSSSSRAIPVAKLIAEAEWDPAVPTHWGANQKGMQARVELKEDAKRLVELEWHEARRTAIVSAKKMAELGAHKQLVNRLLEPYTHISVVVTGTAEAYSNFYYLRNHPDADPTISRLAQEMLVAHLNSTPAKRNHHIPFVTDSERHEFTLSTMLKLSVARCARVSYLNHDGTNCDKAKDIALHDTLLSSGHFSPFEHQGVAIDPHERSGNFKGWLQYRKTLSGECVVSYAGLNQATDQYALPFLEANGQENLS